MLVGFAAYLSRTEHHLMKAEWQTRKCVLERKCIQSKIASGVCVNGYRGQMGVNIMLWSADCDSLITSAIPRRLCEES